MTVNSVLIIYVIDILLQLVAFQIPISVTLLVSCLL